MDKEKVEGEIIDFGEHFGEVRKSSTMQHPGIHEIVTSEDSL